MTRKQTLVFAALCLVWGSTWIASDSLAEQVPALQASAARFLLSAACCLPLTLRRSVPLPSARALAALLLLSVTMIVFPLLLLRWARPQLPSATVVVLYAGMPLLVILLTPVIEGRDVPRAAMQASILGMGGLLLAMGATFSAAQAVAAAVVLLAVISTGASTFLARRILLRHSPIAVTAWVLGASGLLLALAAMLWERGEPAQWDRSALRSLVVLAVVGGAPAYLAWFWLLARWQAYQVATVQWMEPLIALGETAWFLRMGLSWAMVVGSLVTCVSLLVVIRTREEDDQNVSLLRI